MNQKKWRAAVVGASTMLGREVAEQLAEAQANWQLTLLDEDDASGQMTAAGDEAMVIQALLPGALSDADIVFFACDAATARAHWPEVRRAGGLAVDLSGGLRGEECLVMTSPWFPVQHGEAQHAGLMDLSTKGVICPHPAALLLALVSSRLQPAVRKVKLVTTMLQPASQYGQAALAELQAQTAALLTFQTVPREVFDTQIAFNLLNDLGTTTKPNLLADARQIREDFERLDAGSALELQLLQAPVFHAFAASVYVACDEGADIIGIAKMLEGGLLHVTASDDVSPSNQAAAVDDKVLLTIGKGSDRSGFWLWLAADQLGLSARHAVQCAAELARLRPTGSIQ